MAAEDVVKTQEIASLRIHVEPAFNKIKNFQIWDRVVPSNGNCKPDVGSVCILL